MKLDFRLKKYVVNDSEFIAIFCLKWRVLVDSDVLSPPAFLNKRLKNFWGGLYIKRHWVRLKLRFEAPKDVKLEMLSRRAALSGNASL